jgi:hypothetical protein
MVVSKFGDGPDVLCVLSLLWKEWRETGTLGIPNTVWLSANRLPTSGKRFCVFGPEPQSNLGFDVE